MRWTVRGAGRALPLVLAVVGALVLAPVGGSPAAADPASIEPPAPSSASSAATSPGRAVLCATAGHDAGFRDERLVTAVAVGLAESGCNPLARGVNGPTAGCAGGSVDRGLWQINSCYHPDVPDACAYDAGCNARAAFRISAGGTSWRPWSSFNSGRYLSFLAEARAAVSGLGATTLSPSPLLPPPLKEVFAFGGNPDLGSTAGAPLAAPLVGMAPTRSGGGYWLLGGDGGVFSFGDATFLGSTGGIALHQPVVGIAPTPTGNGYWLVASDGGIFSYGDAAFLGSTGGIALQRPVVGMAPTTTGSGYWAVASDGGIFTYGDASFLGSMAGAPPPSSVVGMDRSPTGAGYRMVSGAGEVFAFGDAPYLGAPDPALLRSGRAVGVASHPLGGGYWVVATRLA